MDLHSQSLNVVCAIRSTCEVGQVELNLVPPFVQTHRHRADERLDSGGGLVIGGPEASANIFVVEDLDFEREVFLELGLGLTFLMIMTRKGSLMPRVLLDSAGQVM